MLSESIMMQQRCYGAIYRESISSGMVELSNPGMKVSGAF
jgi:hypothetical protein